MAAAKRFNGGEGCYHAGGTCWFTTKVDRVWAYNAVNSTIDLAYDDSLVVGGPAPLTGVDNVTASASGDLFVAEDGRQPGDLHHHAERHRRAVPPGPGAELVGDHRPGVQPNGSRLYFSSQRGTSGSSSGGITYEVTGPFRT